MLTLLLWKMGKRALSTQKRSGANIVELVSAVSIFLGFYVFLFTLILLIHLGIRMWTNRKKGVSWRKDLPVFLLTLILFFKGPGEISLDKLLGNT